MMFSRWHYIMKKSIKVLKRQLDALYCKIDPDTVEMLSDHYYAVQLAECVTQIYILINEEMCDVRAACSKCASHRDFLRKAVEVFEQVVHSNEIDEQVTGFYFCFVTRLQMIRNITENLNHEKIVLSL